MALPCVAPDGRDQGIGVTRGEGLDDRGVLVADETQIGHAAPAGAPGDARLVVERIERPPELGIARSVDQRLVEELVVVDERDELAVAILAVVARPDARVDLAQTRQVCLGRALAGAHGAGALDHLARLEEVAQLRDRERRQRRVAHEGAEADQLLTGQARQRLAHRSRADAQADGDRLDHDALARRELVVDDLRLEQQVDVLGEARRSGHRRGRPAVVARRLDAHASGTRYSAPTSVSNSSIDVSAVGRSNVMRPFCSRHTRSQVSSTCR